MKTIAVTGFLGMILNVIGLTWFPTRQPLALAIGLSLYIASLVVLIWTMATLWLRRPLIAFSAEPAPEVYRRGPYGWVRHPFYFAYSLMWLGGAVVIPWFLGWPVFVVMLVQYVSAIRFEERQFLAGDLKSAYAEYKQKVGMFWPKIWRSRELRSYEEMPRHG